MHELASKYNVNLKKIMGVNVAFDTVDNTDDYEPFRTPDLNLDKTKLLSRDDLTSSNNRYTNQGHLKKNLTISIKDNTQSQNL